ncbi:C1 family peptidase [Bdellovibrionota bacterium FG-1]
MDHATTSLSRIPTLGSVDEALAALNRGNPVYVGLRVPAGMGRHESVICSDSAWTKGGHAVAIVGYHLDPKIKSGGYFIIKNSWGPQAGDQGYQYMSFDICQKEVRPDMYCMFWEVQGVDHTANPTRW